ncbi:hypothetical protein RISK_001983 [Rhodopirellula islandica]|uniref:Uncharacterized protein n=1 Tax=Rhodopirellula islandica TaxID=595434 RepID=A0A0J1BHX0_RHOIS|nr:hypothetical protein RISK_001983 [Rhodopirellula islandica]
MTRTHAYPVVQFNSLRCQPLSEKLLVLVRCQPFFELDRCEKLACLWTVSPVWRAIHGREWLLGGSLLTIVVE